MMRATALSLLLATLVSIAAPALAPAPAWAGEGTPIEAGPVPWPQVGKWILKNALTLLMLAEEIWRDLQGGDNNPPPATSPPPPPNALAEAA
jgi:hypothetical protein